MWDYTEKTLDHFKNPRNVGKIENPDGVGQVGSLACGDSLTLMFKLGDDGRIADVKFQTFGCASAIASSSALTEMALGKTLDEAAAITNQAIADYLGGLPEEKMHCSVMGREALEAAIHNYKTGETVIKELPDEHDTLVCKCFNLRESEIRRVIRENALTTVEQVTHYCKAGGACGTCKDDIARLLACNVVLAEGTQNPEPRTQNGDISDGDDSRRGAPACAPSPPKMTILEKIRLIEEVIDREIRPLLALHGGGINLVDIDGDEVTVAFSGMCAGCSSALLTLNGLVQAKLREHVSPTLSVKEG
ncbi:MAG: Fe-S cluster assembly protein NifU [Kiritimatiellaeota bacterium]|nr:Fe-S cluster assembly protein NifU [Kiritimatiellota bacterium]